MPVEEPHQSSVHLAVPAESRPGAQQTETAAVGEAVMVEHAATRNLLPEATAHFNNQ